MASTTAGHSALIPMTKTQNVLVNVYGQSAFLQQADVQPTTEPVVDLGLEATFEDADFPAGMANVAELGVKPEIGDAAFQDSQLVVRKMAATKVISDELSEDSVLDVFNFYQEAIEQRFAYLIDFHALNGGGWAGSEGLLPALTALGSGVVTETNNPRQDSSDMLAHIEENGFVPTGFIFDIRKKQDFRDQLDTTGRPIFVPAPTEGGIATLHGEQVNFLAGGLFRVAPGEVRGFAGDFSNYSIRIRSQIDARIYDQGIVGGVNLIEQNAKALRVEMRLGAKVRNAEAFSVLRTPAV